MIKIYTIRSYMLFFIGMGLIVGPVACTPVLATESGDGTALSVSGQSKISSSEQNIEARSPWKIKAEIESQTNRDKKAELDGYSSEAKIQLRRDLSEKTDGLFGIKLSDERRRNKDSIQSFDEAFVGIKYSENFLGLDWNSDWTVGLIPDKKLREKNQRSGNLELDLKTTLLRTTWSKTRLRAQWKEYLITTDTASIERRKTRIELSPSIYSGAWSLGIQNKLQHRFVKSEDSSTFDVAPFVKFESKNFEPMFKVSYRPFISGDNRYYAVEWDSRPTYSLEVEIR